MNILDQEVILEFFRTHYEQFIALVFLLTFGLTFYLIPKVLWVSQEKNLMASVNERSSHSKAVPTFGGVAFYIAIIMVLTILQSLRLTYVGNHLIAAMTILFMVGLKDDLVISTAKVKFLGQITAACFLVFSPEFQLTSLHGFLGIYEIPVVLGYFITGFIVLALINAYNLIDGIDGLAAIVGIVISLVFVFIFYATGQPFFALASISLAGVLTAFLRFNFSRGRRKIFMGDSGSLLVGLLLSFLSLKFLAMEPYSPALSQGYDPAHRLLFLACILFVPAFDTLRVIIIRKIKGQSPFSPDRNHAHHVLLDLGLSHKKASFSLGLLNLVVVSLYISLSNLLSQVWLLFLVVLLYSVTFLLFGWFKVLGARQAKGSVVGSR
ncbi:undecaprenyl/decaprenyl-phosphate alpha-N-acetylglucosaminyl 1-phosphate transferase [Salinimicrobium tongyeongense]|uniref:Undecaprenyl/decaprenyl-phosphate alpha-N-acetylglucosaminyl 1-phosphate transferase n=1 Tax=Salinimicrobium tongyeongense TaxID=2809707 RepID=A0ABY6NP15_9FLAO|nr:MraY family glycosyltransferase [Salinimicrobium tongyeongense]UZH54640.1 undecaprenyl/decaprenyl-phosphate alpha-N-acetylglucosaminyl 1-phosphate transferase [Salinimicrobium tongyeongense]